MRAITVREPFATLIAMGVKCVENRSLPVPGKFPLPMTIAIHAGADADTIGDDIDECINADSWLVSVFSNPACKPCVPGSDYFYCQTIVGTVDIVGCVNIADCVDDLGEIQRRVAEFGECDDVKPNNCYFDWAMGPRCYILRNARRFRTGIMCRGQLGWWKLTPEMQDQVVTHSSDLLINPSDMPTKPIGGVPKCPGKPMAARA